MIDLQIVSALFVPGGYNYGLPPRASIEDVSALNATYGGVLCISVLTYTMVVD